MKRRQSFLVVFAIILFVSIYMGGSLLASVVWKNFRNAPIALRLDRNDAVLAIEIGKYYFNDGAYDLKWAKKAYQKAVSIEPNILWGHYQLARIYFVEGKFDLALEEITKELEANPENLRSLYIRGLIYGYRNQIGDLEKADADFQRFTEWAPSEWAGYNDLAWILSKEGKYGKAETEIKKAFQNVSDGDKNPWLWTALGVAELNLKKYSNAITSFKKAKDLAGKLTIEEWHRSYPGNDPATSQEGLTAFLVAIDENLRRAESKR